MVVCNPNDPTGDYLPSQSLRWLMSKLPEQVHVFIGDVRAGSVKRVASAVGEGSVVIHQVHRHLESLRPASRR